jgi:crotonobetainyl-CoA:carnitine CoA-transferase CaiB-like acyl-CoA transferase
MVDYSGGLVAALALLAGVHAARRDGAGMDCDTSLFDVAISMLSYVATWHLTGGFAPTRQSHSAHPSIVPFQAFQTADGWIVVACAKEVFWRRCAQAIGRPELAEDERFRDFASRRTHAAQLTAILGDTFRAAPSADWLSRLGAAAVPCGPVNDVGAALADSHTQARDMVLEVPHPDFGIVRQPASPVKVGDRARTHRRAPRPGEHRDEVLGKLLGYTRQEIDRLAQDGAFGEYR